MNTHYSYKVYMGEIIEGTIPRVLIFWSESMIQLTNCVDSQT